MLFKKEWLIDSLDTDDGIEDKVTGKSRWEEIHRRVFEHEGKFYETFYRMGLTECQESLPYEYDPDEIECHEVEPIEVTVTKYQRVQV